MLSNLLSSGSAPQQASAQQMLHANMRPPMPGAQPIQYNQPKGPMPSMDNSHAHQLSNGDQNTSRSVALETTQAEKVVKFYLFLIDLEFNYAYTVNLSMRHFLSSLECSLSIGFHWC